MNNKLLIIYRACGKEMDSNSFNQSRPDWFSKKKCWESFYMQFGWEENTDIIVVFDGSPDEEFAKYLNSFDINGIKYLNNIGNKESLIYCYELAKKSEFDYVFFAEDDYLYLPNSYNILIEGLNSIDGFITLYGHLNRYLDPKQTGDITFGQDYVLLSQSSFWRSEDSTTGSVAMSKEFFNLVIEDLIKFNISDCGFYREQLLKNNRRVFSPLPPKSTHVNKFFSSPLINWQKYNNSIEI